jgi:hypothetical protein
MPEWLWKEQRVKGLSEAISRRAERHMTDDDKQLVKMWCNEILRIMDSYE